jgi:hypothetical protein
MQRFQVVRQNTRHLSCTKIIFQFFDTRKRTSDAWNKKNIISKAIKLNKNKSEDMQLLDQFESIKALFCNGLRQVFKII